MAAPIIKIKRSAVPGKLPSISDLNLGELALNTYEGHLYTTKNVGAGNTVIVVNPFRVGSGTDSYDAYFTQGNIGIGTEFPSGSVHSSNNAVLNVGIVTANYLYGDGSNLTGIANAQLSNEQVQDIVGGMVSGNTESGITVTYEDSDGTIDFSVASQTDNNFTTDLKNKLDGIEASATADQTAAEIRTLVESAGDSNVFTDADHTKLDGIETGATADQTKSDIDALGIDADQLDSQEGSYYLNYNNFSNTPTIPTNNNQLTNGAGYVTANTQLSNEQVQDIVGGMVSSNTESGITVTYEDSDGTLDFSVASQTDNNFTTTLKNKLDGIDAGATNVTNNNQLTNGAGYVTSNTQLSNEQVQDIVGGMVSNNTESGITVTYEDSDGTLDFSVASQTDNNFTTALKNKLDGIEASADVTDATNVNAAGAVMNSDSTTASMSFVIDEDNMSSNSATKVPTQQSVKAYVDSEVSSLVDAAPGALDTLNELASAINDDANFSTTVTNSIATKLPLAGGTMTGNIIMSGTETVDGRDLSVDGTKLDGIETGATADQTKADIDALGIDADQLDSQEGSYYLNYNNFTNTPTIPTNNNQLTNGAGYVTANTQLSNEQVQDIVGGMVSSNTESGITVTYEDSDGTIDFSVASQTDNNFTTTLKNKLDGIETGATADQTKADIDALNVDADTLDGVQASSFLRSDADDTMTGALTIDVDNKQNGALRITANQTNPDNDFYFAQEIVSTLSGTTATTADREQGGIYMDINSTATGGDTDNEHRAYGIYLDLDVTGDADIAYGIYADSTVTPTTGQVSNVTGIYGRAEDNGGAGSVSNVMGVRGDAVSDNSTSDINNMYGGYFKSTNTADTGNITAAHGCYAEIEIASGTGDHYGNSYVFRAEFDNNDLSVSQTNTTYLYYGNYASNGALPTNAYGIYINSDVDNYFAGNVTSNTTVQGSTLKSTVATGTAPLTVTSTTKVTNFNADQLDGQEGSYYLNYTNLTNTPTIPTNNNQLTNGAGYVTSNTQLSNEQVQDIVGGMVSSNTESGITVTYQDGDGTIDFSVASQTDNNFTTTLKNKLDGIETGATADQTKADIDALNVDADTLDGIDSTSFLRSDAADIKTSGNLTFNNNVRANFGTNNDLEIYHSSANGTIRNNTGSLYLRTYADNERVHIQSDNGSGGITDYFKADGSTGESILYHYGSQKLATKSTGVTVAGTLTASGSINVNGDIVGNNSTTVIIDIYKVFATKFIGDLIGDVTGNADTATTATNVTVTANNSTNETVYPVFVDGATGDQGPETDTGLSYNPSTGTLTATSFSGSGASLTAVDADTLDGQQGSYYTGYTDTAIANLIDSSPGTLNTLNELAAALGDDASFSTTVTNSIATKLPLAGGTMTGSLNMGSNNITTTGKVLFANMYSALGDLPSATTYHGMFAHVHGTGKGYFAHGGNWVQLLDTNDESSFLTSDANDTKTSGNTTFNDNISVYFGSGNDCQLFCNGSHMYMDLQSGIGNFYIRDGTTTRFTFDDNGDFTAVGNVTAYSDITLKKNIEVIPNALDKVMQLRGITFDRKDIETSRQSGVIAQEVEKVLPEVVDTNEEGIKSVAYGNLVGLLIEAIKDLKNEVDELKK